MKEKAIRAILSLTPRKFFLSFAYHIFFLKLIERQFLGLQFGPGEFKIADFLNIDAYTFANCDVVANTNKIKLASHCTETIYASHLFEHVDRYKARNVLMEWYRLLKPGGKLYILVPDLEALSRLYLENIEIYETEKGKYIADFAMDIIFGGQINSLDFHYYGYSYKTLCALLEAVGFKNVTKFNREEIIFCPHRDAGYAEIEGVPVSLNLVAEK